MTAPAIAISRLDDGAVEAYDAFVRRMPDALFYHGTAYRRLLRRFLGAEDRYFVARNDAGTVVGVLPSFMTGGDRPVLNSLPFYGSHGGPIVDAAHPAARRALLEAFDALAADANCAAATIVASPFDGHPPSYDDIVVRDATDDRLGQITPLPEAADGAADELMRRFHHKSRTAIRKAQSLAMTVGKGPDADAFEFLVHTHESEIAAKGGLPKPRRFFSMLADTLEYGRDYDIWFARHGGRLVAALLLLYFNRTVEYFTPVVAPDARAAQPLSRVILDAMADAVSRGFAFWNWGGTWASQVGLRRFKQRLGARDCPYRSYTRVRDAALLDASPQALAARYPYFFVVPYRLLRTAAP